MYRDPTQECKEKTRRDPLLWLPMLIGSNPKQGCRGFGKLLSNLTTITFYITYRLGLGNNRITDIENGSFANIPRVREIHLEHNKLKKIPSGIQELKYLQVKNSTCVWYMWAFQLCRTYQCISSKDPVGNKKTLNIKTPVIWVGKCEKNTFSERYHSTRTDPSPSTLPPN